MRRSLGTLGPVLSGMAMILLLGMMSLPAQALQGKAESRSSEAKRPDPPPKADPPPKEESRHREPTPRQAEPARISEEHKRADPPKHAEESRQSDERRGAAVREVQAHARDKASESGRRESQEPAVARTTERPQAEARGRAAPTQQAPIAQARARIEPATISGPVARTREVETVPGTPRVSRVEPVARVRGTVEPRQEPFEERWQARRNPEPIAPEWDRGERDRRWEQERRERDETMRWTREGARTRGEELVRLRFERDCRERFERETEAHRGWVIARIQWLEWEEWQAVQVLKVEECRQLLRDITAAAEAFYEDTQELPDSNATLLKQLMLIRPSTGKSYLWITEEKIVCGEIVDPWGRPLVLKLQAPRWPENECDPTAHNKRFFDLYSVGPNGVDERGGCDDIGNW